MAAAGRIAGRQSLIVPPAIGGRDVAEAIRRRPAWRGREKTRDEHEQRDRTGDRRTPPAAGSDRRSLIARR